MFIVAQCIIAKYWKQSKRPAIWGLFQKLYPCPIIQNNFVEVFLWQALLVAGLKSFPVFFCSDRSQILFRAAMFTFQAENHNNPVPTFLASLHLGMAMWSGSGQWNVKRSLLGALRKFFAFLIKGQDSVDTNNHLLQTLYLGWKINYLLGKNWLGFLLFGAQGVSHCGRCSDALPQISLQDSQVLAVL